MVPAQHLRLRMLGAPDHRSTDDRGGSPAVSPAWLRSRRAAGWEAAGGAQASHDVGGTFSAPRSHAPPLREEADRAPAPARTAGRCRVDHSSPGGRRLLGRHPAPVGLLADGPAPARLPNGPPGDEEGDRRARQLRHLPRPWPMRWPPVAKQASSSRWGCRTTPNGRCGRSTRRSPPGGIPLATNQIEYSLLRTMLEKSGLLAACRALCAEVLPFSRFGEDRADGTIQ